MANVREAILEYRYAVGAPAGFSARWTSRIAVFSLVLLITAFLLHRFMSLPTPAAMNLAGFAIAGAALAVYLALKAGSDIWQTGRDGAARVVFGGLVGGLLLTLPVGVWIFEKSEPAIFDVTTDVKNPPAYNEIARLRPADANRTKYAGSGSATLQASTHPDLKPVVVNRPTDEVFELAVEALKRLKIPIVKEAPPDMSVSRPGFIEASDRTLIFGFADDIVVRVSGSGEQSIVDVRSSARYGSHDYGRNAQRIREILREFDQRLAANPVAGQRAVVEKPVLKPVRERSRQSPSRRTQRDRARREILRVPGLIE